MRPSPGERWHEHDDVLEQLLVAIIAKTRNGVNHRRIGLVRDGLIAVSPRAPSSLHDDASRDVVDAIGPHGHIWEHHGIDQFSITGVSTQHTG